jgi:hypothetical protein
LVAASRTDCSSAGVSLPCSPDAVEDRRAALLELAQVDQPFGQRAQLRVVEAPVTSLR